MTLMPKDQQSDRYFLVYESHQRPKGITAEVFNTKEEALTRVKKLLRSVTWPEIAMNPVIFRGSTLSISTETIVHLNEN